MSVPKLRQTLCEKKVTEVFDLKKRDFDSLEVFLEFF